jgi:methenyltetrahydromethanopterin cyclohydrolase
VNLNARAAALVRAALVDDSPLCVVTSRTASGATIVDCGVAVEGGIGAGLLMARACLADLATVALEPAPDGSCPLVQVHTDQPIAACLASQYAGWEIKSAGYFAMGSGPMRAAAGREPLFEEIGRRETAVDCVGILESSSLPPDGVCREIAIKCGVDPAHLVLLVAPTRSLAGTLHIVARSVETALHKLHELKFDLNRVVSGWGAAPLPPPTHDDLAAIGRTNDAILYGARVILYVRGDDASLSEIGPRIPSSASRDYGRPFVEVLAAYDNDFYKVDPLLFSPAMITLSNEDTGHSQTFGQLDPPMLARSFGG